MGFCYFITFFGYSSVQHLINLNTVIIVWKLSYGKNKSIYFTANMFTDLKEVSLKHHYSLYWVSASLCHPTHVLLKKLKEDQFSSPFHSFIESIFSEHLLTARS